MGDLGDLQAGRRRWLSWKEKNKIILGSVTSETETGWAGRLTSAEHLDTCLRGPIRYFLPPPPEMSASLSARLGVLVFLAFPLRLQADSLLVESLCCF